MDMQTLREKARAGMKGFCSMCAICDGRACAGKVPGMGGSLSGGSFKANYQALQNVRLNMRVVHDVQEQAVDTSYTFFGLKLNTPIMNGPIASPNANCGPYDDLEFQKALALGAEASNSLYWMGDPAKEDLFMNGCKAMKAAGRGVVIAKPHIDKENIRKRFEWAAEAGAVAYGMDLDGAGILLLKKLGFPVGPKNLAQLKEIRALVANKPFIVKGIMTVEDALLCRDAGVDAIVVSNHGGRVLDGLPGVAAVLPAIKKAIGNDMRILADGAVRSGVDTLKMLALGAEAVLIGRPACWGVYGGDIEGVQCIIDTYTTQLMQAMILTGLRDMSADRSHLLYAE